MAKYPYGLADFRALRLEGYFYADRTHLIPELEDYGKQLIFLRPRRFGKSLLLSMLANYYDVNRADEFEALFGDLAIGANPTDKHNQFLVLQWNFSEVETNDDPKIVRRNLFNHVNDRIKTFYEEYSEFVKPRSIDPENAIVSLGSMLATAKFSGYRVYVLIDEYDNFANAMAMSQRQTDHSRYDDLLIGEGSMKTLFATLKAAAGRGELDRIFITGVAPMVLSDMTSGFNTGQNISFLSKVSDVCGFTQTEIRNELEQLVPDPDEHLQQMRLLYNGYNFDPYHTHDRLYHPTLALYYLNSLQETGMPPKNPYDMNLSMDADKLSWFARVIGGTKVLETLTNDEDPLTIAVYNTEFRLRQLLEKRVSPDDLALLITYFGMATLAGEDIFRNLQLRIPNTVIRRLYLEELTQRLIPADDQPDLKTVANQLFQTGDITPLCEMMEHRVLPIFSNRDYRHGEATVKTAFMMALFNDTQYLPVSEATLHRRYADAVFIVKPDYRTTPLKDILIEFKYLKLADLKMSAEDIKTLSTEQLQQLPLVQDTLDKARTQRDTYTQSLLHDFPNAHLHTYTVLSLGFERLLWETEETEN